MTVNTTTSFTTWQGNGSATAFDFSFDMGSASYAVVYRTLISTGVQTLIPANLYTLVLGASAGGTLTYPKAGTPLSSLYTITLQRSVPITQDVNLINQAAFYPEVIEAEFDKLTMIDQQLNDFWNGLTPPPPNYVGQTLQFDSVAALRANAIVPTVSGQQAMLRGYYAAGIGKGGGQVWFNPSDASTADNGGSVFVDAIGQRWYRVFEGVTDPFMWGAVADVETSSTDGHITVTGTNALPAFQAMFTHAKANTLPMHIPAGKWRLASTWTLDFSSETAVWYNLRPRLYGDGKRATILFFDSGASDGITIVGSTLSDPTALSQKIISGMQIVKVNPSLQGNGLVITDQAHCLVEDVHVWQWNLGIYLLDVQESSFTEVNSSYNNQGMLVLRGNTTQPNAISFRSCTISNNYVYGADFRDAGEMLWLSGSIESNGTSTTSSVQWGMRLFYDTSSQIESGVTATILGCRFEGNFGIGDLAYVNALYDMTTILEGCSFNRDTGRYGTNCIHFEVGGTNKNFVSMDGCSFEGRNAYTPSGARPYIDANDKSKVRISEPGWNSYVDTLEKPDLKTWGLGAGMGMKPSSWGVMSNNTTGISTSGNCFGISNPGTGVYDVAFVNTMSGEYAVVCNALATVNRVCSISNVASGGFTVSWTDLAGVAAATRFIFMCVGGADL